jgi:hypothetical protein
MTCQKSLRAMKALIIRKIATIYPSLNNLPVIRVVCRNIIVCTTVKYSECFLNAKGKRQKLRVYFLGKLSINAFIVAS